MRQLTPKAVIFCSALMVPTTLLAQSEATEAPAAEATETAVAEELLMTSEELQTLVGPVALYPDTLLVQILVAATYPFEILKADRLIQDNEGAEVDAMKELIEAENWDESVAVLATAFPEVLADMAENVDWTEAVGNAMLAQSDDVMDAVQNRREIASESGILVSGEEQTVEVTKSDEGEEAIIIQPTDPEVVYVPQYDSDVVYVQDSNSSGDLLTAGLIGFGSYLVLDAIFSNDDPWNNYWGCRNCGGWNGNPIHRNPNIDIDVDGNVNIGNNIGNNNGDKIKDKRNDGWEPDPKRQKEAQKSISDKRGPDGERKVPDKKQNRGDSLRSDLSKKTGTKDISKAKNPRDSVERAGNIDRGTNGAAKKNAAVNRTGNAPKKGGSGSKAQAVKKSGAVKKPAAAQRPKAQAKPKANSAMQKRPTQHRAKSGGSRGRASAGRGRR